ncbi:chemotaxis protein histidine kinase-like protein [Desulfitobacterium dehalogenans ATCC 51507]|uniref:Chemotaxis protein CheA n=1 Tax=Desulfitobacterium dehalogenans (strain ATCC 51507 / DSM 9161 / JW/IU-DC1) TaxID=756499 RepID=I4ACX7_DESDJ|nr:chemotaxis protein CheA [Desulfitobacterium dehalogenans]AFM01812.1 chemotaxis protein histidine kinase-like protein [Desulfitobacterium dehalogenans ATCC 51507]
MSQEDNQNLGVDLGEFLDFYLLDSQEQIEKLAAGLLQLEKEGNNVGLINDLFRSAHSLKGASGTMGFTSIVALTHSAEDLLDRLRQGKMEVSLSMVDVLLAVTDRVKEMLGQVEKREEITVEYQDLVDEMRALMDGRTPAAIKEDSDSRNEGSASASNYTRVDFQLSDEVAEQVEDSQDMGHGVYQIDIKFAPNTLMKAVRAVMAVQRMENLGKVVKLRPSVEELEVGGQDGFAMLILSDDPPEEIRSEILLVSELAEVEIHPYLMGEAVNSPVVEEVAAAAQAAELLPVVEPTPSQPVQPEVKPVQEIPVKAVAPASNKPASGNGNNAAVDGNNQVHTIRVDTVRMDNLINLVGEMVITRTRLVQIGQELKEQYRMDALVNNLNETTVYLGRLMSDLQESAMRLRMVPIGTVFSRFPRLVRDLARKTQKEMELVLRGEDTELDKTVVEVIGDPLMHLIRNSVDHGIETPEERRAAGKPEVGTITLDAYHEGNHIAILISDDGKGLDLNKIYEKALNRGLVSEREGLSDRDIANLIFMPGFSTADKVTDISGRGVGMDVVKKALNNLGGMIDITTRQGQGTTFTIRLPLTLAIIQALLVEVGTEIYAVPLSSVLETLLVESKDIKNVGGLPMVQLRGNTLPLISLRDKFALPAPEAEAEEVFVVVVGLGDKALGLIVDGLRGQQEVVIKSLGDFLNNLPGIAGATILGDGKVTLILDIGSLIQDILVARKG